MEASRVALVLDSSAVIAMLLDEPAAPRVTQLLQDERVRMSTVQAAEVVDVLVRRGGPPDAVVASVGQLFDTVVEPVTPSVDDGLRAGEVRARLFHRRSRRLSLADCFMLAAAEEGDSIVTTDATLAAAARDEGIDVVELLAA